MHQKKNKGLKILNMSINPCFSLPTRYAQTAGSLHNTLKTIVLHLCSFTQRHGRGRNPVRSLQLKAYVKIYLFFFTLTNIMIN